uniref:Uncharacterized protein n=1 Tax=Rhizophora mucronata TaxID=61149 RepID=A0A2P2MVS2_RHIMU
MAERQRRSTLVNRRLRFLISMIAFKTLFATSLTLSDICIHLLSPYFFSHFFIVFSRGFHLVMGGSGLVLFVFEAFKL